MTRHHMLAATSAATTAFAGMTLGSSEPNDCYKTSAPIAYQMVLRQTGHLKETVAFDAVFTNQYLPA